VREPEVLVKVAAESAMREVVGRTPIQQALTEGRGKIEVDTQALLQKLLDSYGAGIEIRRVQLLAVDPPAQVVDAFNDVQRARADRERLRNEAEAYRNDVIPRARGDAERLIQEAQAYREEVLNRAQGDTKRFLSVYQAYQANKDVTTERMYLETMEQVLKNTSKVILDRGEGGQAVVPYLPLPELKPKPLPPEGKAP
jgi:membrane protease subunit HflK